LSSIFKELGDEVNVVAVKKEIGNLITVEDFENLALDNVKERVIIPGMVLAHDRDIHRAFVRDGKSRLVFRGPDDLTVESERSIYMTQAQVLEKEIEAFTGLIEEINYLGIQIPELSHTPVSTKVGNMAYSCEIADTKRSVQASGKEKIKLTV
jgi:NifB/MoaA-like Fe-S oxidoreductase